MNELDEERTINETGQCNRLNGEAIARGDDLQKTENTLPCQTNSFGTGSARVDKRGKRQTRRSP